MQILGVGSHLNVPQGEQWRHLNEIHAQNLHIFFTLKKVSVALKIQSFKNTFVDQIQRFFKHSFIKIQFTIL